MNRIAINPQRTSVFQSERVDCRPDQSEVFTSSFNTYLGTTATDRVMDVASGKGANIGKTYAAGYLGNVGWVQRYSAAGACEVGQLFTHPAGGTVTGIAVNANGVYISGIANAGDVPITYRLNIDGATVPWGWYWSDGATQQYAPNIGIRGVSFLGGVGAAAGIFFSGVRDNQGLVAPPNFTSFG
jgi:hypothetical protein